jgi:hypothetical protein
MFRVAVISFLFVLAASSRSFADPLRWTLNDVTFGRCLLVGAGPCEPGGTASGSFVFDASARAFSDWSIRVTGGDGLVFPPFTYNPSNSDAIFHPFDQALLFFGPPSPIGDGRNRFISFVFSTPLTDAGGRTMIDLANGSSVECYNCAPLRFFASGQVRSTPGPVPEPPTLLLTVFGWAVVLARRTGRWTCNRARFTPGEARSSDRRPPRGAPGCNTREA